MTIDEALTYAESHHLVLVAMPRQGADNRWSVSVRSFLSNKDDASMARGNTLNEAVINAVTQFKEAPNT